MKTGNKIFENMQSKADGKKNFLAIAKVDSAKVEGRPEDDFYRFIKGLPYVVSSAGDFVSVMGEFLNSEDEIKLQEKRFTKEACRVNLEIVTEKKIEFLNNGETHKIGDIVNSFCFESGENTPYVVLRIEQDERRRKRVFGIKI